MYCNAVQVCMTATERLSVRIPKELDEKIERERTKGEYEVKRSAVVRAALEKHLCDSGNE